MASITSVVAFLILLLATFSYSAPIGEEYGNSTSEYEYTTNQNMVDWKKPGNMRSMVDDESTSVPAIREDQSSEENDVTTEYVTRSSRNYEDSSYSPATDRTVERNYEEYTSPSSDKMNEKRLYEYSTSSPTSESSEELNHETYSSPASMGMNPKRNYEESTYPSTSESSEERNHERYSSPSSLKMNEKRIYEYSTYVPTSESSEESSETYSSPSSTELNQKRSIQTPSNAESNTERAVEDFLYTTLESSTEFNQRAIRPAESDEQIDLSTTIYPQHHMDMINDTEPISSAHSFVKYTGLLVDQENTTPEYETTDRPEEEESRKYSSVHPERLTKTVSIIPGKITETKIYANAPSKTSVVIQPVEQEQLSQVQNQPVAQTKESDN